jgi:hypothetical protein
MMMVLLVHYAIMVDEIEMIIESVQNSHPVVIFVLRLLLDRSHEWGEAPLPAIAGLMLMLPFVR